MAGRGFRPARTGHFEPMLAAAVVLIVLGIVLGLFFPVMFIAAAAGIALLLVFFFGAGRRAKTGAVGTDEPGSRAE